MAEAQKRKVQLLVECSKALPPLPRPKHLMTQKDWDEHRAVLEKYQHETVHAVGDVIEVDAKEAERLIAVGHAVDPDAEE